MPLVFRFRTIIAVCRVCAADQRDEMLFEQCSVAAEQQRSRQKKKAGTAVVEVVVVVAKMNFFFVLINFLLVYKFMQCAMYVLPYNFVFYYYLLL